MLAKNTVLLVVLLLLAVPVSSLANDDHKDTSDSDSIVQVLVHQRQEAPEVSPPAEPEPRVDLHSTDPAMQEQVRGQIEDLIREHDAVKDNVERTDADKTAAEQRHHDYMQSLSNKAELFKRFGGDVDTLDESARYSYLHVQPESTIELLADMKAQQSRLKNLKDSNQLNSSQYDAQKAKTEEAIADLVLDYLGQKGNYTELDEEFQTDFQNKYGKPIVPAPPPQCKIPPQIYYRRINFADPKRVAALLLASGLVDVSELQLYADVNLGKDGDKIGFVNFAKLEEENILGKKPPSTDPNEDSNKSILDPTNSPIGDPNPSELSSTLPRYVQVTLETCDADERWEKINSLINILDRRPYLIDLEVKICEVSTTNESDLGLRVDGKNSTRHNPVEIELTEQGKKGSNPSYNEPFSLEKFHRSAADLLLSVDSMIDHSQASLLAHPVLSTVEGKEADYFAGEYLPYAGLFDARNVAASSVSLKRAGIYMCFVPMLEDPHWDSLDGSTELHSPDTGVGCDGNSEPYPLDQMQVTIDIKAMISTVGQLENLGPVSAFRINDREVSSKIRVRNGEPYCLAGMITTNDIRSWQKVPILGDVPLIGKLFRSKDFTKERSDVLIFITPHVRECNDDDSISYMYGN